MLALNLELDKAIDKIRHEKAKRVCIQLPDGLKPKAMEIQQMIEEKTDAEVLFWAGSCYGACDVPVSLEKYGVDLIIQFGHADWHPKLEGFDYTKQF